MHVFWQSLSKETKEMKQQTYFLARFNIILSILSRYQVNLKLIDWYSSDGTDWHQTDIYDFIQVSMRMIKVQILNFGKMIFMI